MASLPRRLAAEFIGTLLLVTIVVGSGIAASRLSPSDVGLQLLENSIATALGLAVLIAVLAPVSGAHLNPLVTIVDAILRRRRVNETALYCSAQVLGAIVGAILANLMFGLPAVTVSRTQRLDLGTALGEIVATAGLIAGIFILVEHGRATWIPAVVAAWIGSAYFFTSSTSFANPAVTIGRILSDTFAGIAPLSSIGFIAAQLVGAVLGYGATRLFAPPSGGKP